MSRWEITRAVKYSRIEDETTGWVKYAPKDEELQQALQDIRREARAGRAHIVSVTCQRHQKGKETPISGLYDGREWIKPHREHVGGSYKSCTAVALLVALVECKD